MIGTADKVIPAALLQSMAQRGGREPGCGQDPADRSRAGAMAGAEESAVDAPVPPPWVLPGQPPDQPADFPPGPAGVPWCSGRSIWS